MRVSVFTSWNSGNKRTTNEKTGFILFIIRKLFFLSKNVIFFYIFKIFFTMLHLKIFLKH